MPRLAIDLWLPFLEEVIAFTAELDPDFKIGTLDRAGVIALRDNLKATLSGLDSLQAQLGLGMGERDEEIDEIQELSTKLKGAVVARYGTRSVQAKRCPKPKRRAAPAAPLKDPSK